MYYWPHFAQNRFPEKNPVFPKFGKNGKNLSKNRPFSIFLKIGSNDFLGFLDIVRGEYWPHFAENRMFGKIPVPELRTEIYPNLANSTFFQMPIIWEGAEQIQICFDFLKDERLYFRVFSIRFSISPLLHPENRVRKSGPEFLEKPGFLIFKFGSKDSSGFHHAVRG